MTQVGVTQIQWLQVPWDLRTGTVSEVAQRPSRQVHFLSLVFVETLSFAATLSWPPSHRSFEDLPSI